VQSMPCYLFTYHSYGSWMPDRARGYVKRKRGILSRDIDMAAKYHATMKESAVEFDNKTQDLILEAILISQSLQSFGTHFISTEVTHVHVLVGWRDARTWLRMRSSIKGSITRYLNNQIARREWFVEGGSRKRVKDREHFDYLVATYLPRHRGWKWSPEKGKYR
jgi:hypothetical protein